MTLYILNKNIKKMGVAAIAVALFGIIYEHFAHGVISLFMICGFTIPLVGMLFYLLICMFEKKMTIHLPNTSFTQPINAGIITLTIGSLVKGAFDIYGTSNSLTIVYIFVGVILLLIGLLKLLISVR